MTIYQLKPALRIISIDVDPQVKTVEILAERDGITAFFLSLIGIHTSCSLLANASGFVVETSNFGGETRTYSPAASISAVVYTMSRPLEYLALCGFLTFASFGLLAESGPVGLVLIAIAIAVLVAFFKVRKRTVLGFVTDASTGELLKLKANQSEMNMLIQANEVMESISLEASRSVAPNAAAVRPSSSKNRPPTRPAIDRITATCPSCNQQVTASASRKGQYVACPGCSQSFQLPS